MKPKSGIISSTSISISISISISNSISISISISIVITSAASFYKSAEVAQVSVTLMNALCAAGMLFGWEFILNFILVSTVYAVAIGQPTFGKG